MEIFSEGSRVSDVEHRELSYVLLALCLRARFGGTSSWQDYLYDRHGDVTFSGMIDGELCFEIRSRQSTRKLSFWFSEDTAEYLLSWELTDIGEWIDGALEDEAQLRRLFRWLDYGESV